MGMVELIIVVLWITAVILMAVRVSTFQKPQKPKKPQKIDMGACMTIGSREIQEDCYGTMKTHMGILAVLADGMGKAYGGRIASRTAVETFKSIFEDYNAFDNPPYFFRKAFNSANREILKRLDNGQNGTASVGAAVFIGNKLYYAVAGNVKVCVYREGELVPMSVGHTIGQLAEDGYRTGRISREDAIALLENRRLYNYVGQDEFRDIELYDTPVTLKQEDVVVLMSDGIFEPLSWKEIEDILATRGECNKMAFEIVQKINLLDGDNKDNASLVMIRV